MRYKFRYYNGIFKVLNALLVPWQNLLLPQFVIILIARLVSLIGLGQYFNNDTVIGILQKIILIVSVAWTIIYCVFKKGVFLYNDHLVIAATLSH